MVYDKHFKIIRIWRKAFTIIGNKFPFGIALWCAMIVREINVFFFKFPYSTKE